MEKNYKKIDTRPVEPSIGKTHNQHENAVALLDVDSTLMFGAFGRMSGVNKTPRINQSLLDELKKNSINKSALSMPRYKCINQSSITLQLGDSHSSVNINQTI